MATASVTKSPDWKELVRLFLRCDKSEKAFCREQGVNPNTFNYHKRRILAADEPAGFIPVRRSGSDVHLTELSLELPFGIKLHVRGHVQ